jgi:hypothetical protein
LNLVKPINLFPCFRLFCFGFFILSCTLHAPRISATCIHSFLGPSKDHPVGEAVRVHLAKLQEQAQSHSSKTVWDYRSGMDDKTIASIARTLPDYALHLAALSMGTRHRFTSHAVYAPSAFQRPIYRRLPGFAYGLLMQQLDPSQKLAYRADLLRLGQQAFVELSQGTHRLKMETSFHVHPRVEMLLNTLNLSRLLEAEQLRTETIQLILRSYLDLMSLDQHRYLIHLLFMMGRTEELQSVADKLWVIASKDGTKPLRRKITKTLDTYLDTLALLKILKGPSTHSDLNEKLLKTKYLLSYQLKLVRVRLQNTDDIETQMHVNALQAMIIKSIYLRGDTLRVLLHPFPIEQDLTDNAPKWLFDVKSHTSEIQSLMHRHMDQWTTMPYPDFDNLMQLTHILHAQGLDETLDMLADRYLTHARRTNPDAMRLHHYLAVTSIFTQTKKTLFLHLVLTAFSQFDIRYPTQDHESSIDPDTLLQVIFPAILQDKKADHAKSYRQKIAGSLQLDWRMRIADRILHLASLGAWDKAEEQMTTSFAQGWVDQGYKDALLWTHRVGILSSALKKQGQNIQISYPGGDLAEYVLDPHDLIDILTSISHSPEILPETMQQRTALLQDELHTIEYVYEQLIAVSIILQDYYYKQSKEEF